MAKNRNYNQSAPKTTPVTDSGDDTLIDITEVKGNVQGFLDKYGKIAGLVVGGILLFVVGVFVYRSFYLAPRQKAAAEKMYKAEYQFQQDSFTNVLVGKPNEYTGAVDIAKKYAGTDAGNLANYYNGIACLRTGDYDNAIKYLNAFDAAGDVMPAIKLGSLGDAYAEKGDFEKALSFYTKAANKGKNDFTTPYYLWKAGMVHEHQNKPEEAKKLYERIKADHPKSTQGEDIDIYLARVGGE